MQIKQKLFLSLQLVNDESSKFIIDLIEKNSFYFDKIDCVAFFNSDNLKNPNLAGFYDFEKKIKKNISYFIISSDKVINYLNEKKKAKENILKDEILKSFDSLKCSTAIKIQEKYSQVYSGKNSNYWKDDQLFDFKNYISQKVLETENNINFYKKKIVNLNGIEAVTSITDDRKRALYTKELSELNGLLSVLQKIGRLNSLCSKSFAECDNVKFVLCVGKFNCCAISLLANINRKVKDSVLSDESTLLEEINKTGKYFIRKASMFKLMLSFMPEILKENIGLSSLYAKTNWKTIDQSMKFEFSFDLNKMIPGHVFRMKEDGTYAEGTFCGNEIKSEDPFMHMYFVEMTRRYVNLFDIDGIRMDLMGVLDYETVNDIYAECKKIKDDFIVYGEGWNMGDVLPEENRAAIINADKLPNIKMFNDFYRDTIINYISGNDSIREDVKKALSGNNDYLNSSQSINYVECHDKYTFFDRMCIYKNDDTVENNIRRCKMALALVMTSRGIPFIHSGEEFLRTKNMIENSYNSSEEINSLDWKLRVKNDNIVNYFKDLVEIRQSNDEFYRDNVNVYFEDYYECLIYHLDNIMIIINPCMWDHTYNDGNYYNILLDIDGKTVKNTNSIEIPAYSVLICKR